MNAIQVLVVNADSTKGEEYTFSIIKELRANEIGVTYTDFLNMPTYIKEAITNGDMDMIVLSSRSDSIKRMYPQIDEQLNNINGSNLPIIVMEDASKIETVPDSNNSISLASNDLIKRIKKLVESNNKIHKKIKKIAHIGIAVRDIEDALPFYTDLLGLELEAMEVVNSEDVKVAFLKIGESRIELLEPLSSSSPVHRFLENKGEGIHHLALEVDHIQARINQLKMNGIKLINEEPKYGANKSKIAFIHPKSTNGVLFELCQYTVERES